MALSHLVRRVRISRPIHIHLPRSPGAMYVNTHSTTQPSGRPLDRHTHRDSRSGAPGILEEGAYPVVVEGAPFPRQLVGELLGAQAPSFGRFAHVGEFERSVDPWPMFGILDEVKRARFAKESEAWRSVAPTVARTWPLPQPASEYPSCRRLGGCTELTAPGIEPRARDPLWT